MNYQELSKEIIIGLRGKLSQRDLSSKLGFQFNQIGKWETGATLFHWQDFTKLCDGLEIPWRKHTQEVFLFHSLPEDEGFPIFNILCQFHGPLELDDVASVLHKSRSSVQRLLHDQVKLDFVDVLRLMDYRPYVLQSWLTRFIALAQLPAGAEKFERETVMFKSLLSVPWAPIVNAALRLDGYRDLEHHSDQWLSDQTAVSVHDVQIALAKLLETGAIQKRGEKYVGLFQEITMLKIPEFRRVTQYLNETIAAKFSVTGARKPNFLNPSISATRVYPVSSEGSRALADAVVEFHHKVSAILKADQGAKNHVRAIVLHSLDMSALVDAKVESSAAEPVEIQAARPARTEV